MQAPEPQMANAIWYTVPLLKEDRTIKTPIGSWSFWLDLPRGMQVITDPELTLILDASPTILANQGFLTLHLNEQAISSIAIKPGGEFIWKVTAPRRLLKPGFNEFRFENRQRSSEGLCRDVDNPANWIRYKPTSSMKFARAGIVNMDLRDYPFPFIDPLAKDTVQSVFFAPTQPSSVDIEAMMGLCAGWGERMPASRIRVVAQIGATPKSNAVVVNGQANDLDKTKLELKRQPNGSVRLDITGPNSDTLVVGVKALSKRDITDQMPGASSWVPAKMPMLPQDPTVRAGVTTFSQMGYDKIEIKGAFHQSTTFTVRKPIRFAIGKDTELHLKFRHAASLAIPKSIMTVNVNGSPVGSVRLTPENANNGQLFVRIPIEDLVRSNWTIELACFHDLGFVDCSKAWDEVAWTRIEGSSTIELAGGTIPDKAFLDAFPYLITKNGLPANETMVDIGEKPSDQVLGLIGTIATRAAQGNLRWINWRVGPRKRGASTLLVGTYQDKERFAPYKDALFICPTDTGMKISERVAILPGVLDNGAVIQAVPDPQDPDQVIYCVLAADQAALDRVNDAISDPQMYARITGQVAVVRSDGMVIPAEVIGADDTKSTLAREANRYNPTMIWITIGGIAVAFFFFLWVANQFRERKAPIDPFSGQDGPTATGQS